MFFSNQLQTSCKSFPLQLNKRARKKRYQTKIFYVPFNELFKIYKYDSFKFLQQITFDNFVLTYENMIAKCEKARPSVLQRNK